MYRFGLFSCAIFAGLAVLFVPLVASVSFAEEFAELDDCEELLGTPTSVQCTSICSGSGSCRTGTYTWTYGEDNSDYQCCVFTANATAGTPGQWTYVSDTPTPASSCQDPSGDCEGNSLTVGESVTTSETAEASFGYSISSTVKGSVQVKLVAEVGIEVSQEFSAGLSLSSSVSKEHTTTGQVSAPCCGCKVGHLSAFRRTEPATAQITLTLKGRCRNDGVVCDSTWYTLLSDNKTADLTSNSKDSAKQWIICPVTCTTVHQDCEGSSTTTPENPGCQYMVWQGE